MKNKLLLFVFFINIYFLNAQTTAIPNVAFEQKLIDLSIDTNGLNGNIRNSEAQAVTTLTISGNMVTDFTGLQAFTNVVTLNLGTNQFATLPLSTLTALEELVFDQNEHLASLDLSNNVNLKKLDIRANGGNNTAPITVIDLSTNTKLEYIHIYNFKLLQNVIYPNTTTVKYVYLLMFANINVDFSGYSNLETLNLSVNFSNVLAINVILPNNQTTLKSASFQGGNIVNANFANMLGLTYLSMQQTNTQTLQLPSTTTLKTIRLTSHKIDTINFSNASNLEDLNISNKAVNIPLNIDISQNILLKRLNASDNYMTNINVTQNVLLEDINVSNNKLTSITVTQNALLKNLNANYNLLPTINLAQNVLLENLQLNNNVIPTLNVNTNVLLNFIDISNNLFSTTGLNLTKNILLNYFKASFNQIVSLNISQNAVLVTLILDHNAFPGTAILDQFYSLRSNNNGIYGGAFNVSFNKLSGIIPNYRSLFHLGAPGISDWTRFFQFYFNDNNFEFGHFENQHASYVYALTTFSPSPSSNPVMTQYHYAPQAKVNLVQTPTIAAGTPITFTTIVSGAQNHYRWFKNNVAIVGAPDSPNYVIVSANPCDTGIYHCEIRSDLVPFENANPPGTNGKNLLLIRNNITLTVTSATNVCSVLSLPSNNATNVVTNPNITWTDNPNACGYRLNIGTTSGGIDILNNVNVGNVNNYLFTNNLPNNDQIFVTIIPYFSNGTTQTCPAQSFTTGMSTAAVPTCVTTVSPLNNAINIPVNQNFSWAPVTNATGYTVTLGTTPGGSQIVGTTNLATNIFNPTGDLPQGQIVYLTITPSNSDGNAIGCSVFQFTVEVIPSPPTCPASYSITNGQNNVSINLGGISWASVSSQTIYYVSIGTTPGGTQYENYYFNNTSENYVVPTPFAYSTTYYLTITVVNQTAGTTAICSSVQFTTQAAPALVPACTTNVVPANNATNVLVTSDISWNAVATATGYRISIGTTAGGSEILNNFNNGNALIYNPPTNFTQNTIYFVRITPYNGTGNATGCVETRFTTQTIPVVPACTTNVVPADNATNVLVTSNISWDAAPNATGYRISIGTTAGGSEILNNFNNGNALIYNPAVNFTQNTIYFVRIIPYNAVGNAIGCVETRFTTQIIPVVPACTTNVIPANNATNVLVTSDISWNAVATATGYRISIGTTAGGSEILNDFNNGNALIYNPAVNFTQNTIYFVRITPYNGTGNATGCVETRFTTQTIPVVPACTTNVIPANNAANVLVTADISWNAVATATGYRISIGTTAGGSEILNNFDNGNILIYNPPTDFIENTTYFIRITPYNAVGNATACVETRFTTQIIPVVPACATNINPANNIMNALVNTNISWNAVPTATGYRISIGTTAGGSEILNNFDNGNILSYNPPTDFIENTTYFIRITPYNALGNATACLETRFTTIVFNQPPICTTLLFPLANSIDVPINIPTLSWLQTNGVLGYNLTIGTTPNGGEILNNVNVGNGTGYLLPSLLPQNSTIFVKIIPYGVQGSATGCIEQSFRTESITEDIIIPQFFTPNNDGYNDGWSVQDPKNQIRTINIFDRLGKLIKQLMPKDSWNGTYNSEAMPSSDYWYEIHLKDYAVLRGHFALKR